MIDSTPKVVFHAIDLHENFVEVPQSLTEMTHRPHPAATDLYREDRPEAVPPKADCRRRDVNAALMQQVFDIPKRERVAHIHHHRQAEDLGRRLEVAENTGVAHPVR